MGKLDRQVAIITGASHGLGNGIARGFAHEGASLVLAARNAEQLSTAAAEFSALGVEVLAVPTDVRDEEQIEDLFAQTINRFGRLDLLVNNAGVFDSGPLDELTTEAWDHVVAVNLRAPFLCTRAAMRVMKPQRQGRIINIGSIAGKRVRPNTAPYAATKHGLWGLTQVTALEGREYGITCCCLYPGNIQVDRRLTGMREDTEPMMAVEEIAQVAVLMASLPPHVEMLEAVVIPHEQLYVGRG